MSRRTIVSSLGAMVLSAAIAGPALGAAPTFTGSFWCTSTVNGDFTEVSLIVTVTKKEIGATKRELADTGFCVKGTIEFIEAT
jgi:hypothetical protein